MNLSVEVEPPKGIFQKIDEEGSPIYEEVLDYVEHVEMISITNRPVFGLSPLTLASQIHKMVNGSSKTNVRVNLHLTTRLSHFDVFKYVLDAQRVGLTDLLPILGDPRGPKDENYFRNGFDILGFVSFLKTGNTDILTKRYQEMVEIGLLTGPIKNASFNIGSVVDVNPTRIIDGGQSIDIREKEIKFARRKEKLGAEYLISQGLFNADSYFSFVDEADLDIPILAGVIPARIKLINMFGLPIDTLSKQTLRAQFTTDEERALGNQISGATFNDLVDRGCEYIHVYSIGNSKNFSDITGIDLSTEKKTELGVSDKHKEQKLKP